MKSAVVICVFFCACAIQGPAQTNILLDSVRGNGHISWNSDLTNATHYRVEWSPGSEGPWSADWSDLSHIPATGTHYSVAVPLMYRVVAEMEPEVTSDMLLIPRGEFVMGDSYDEGRPNETPVHGVTIDAFLIDRYEIQKRLWDVVASWAQTNGYDVSPLTGLAKGDAHPIAVNWYECTKWCNARSEMENRRPAYYISSAKLTPYRTGYVDIETDWVDWTSGYRLPTEAEWEKAARGGLTGERFPWGQAINHDYANYLANGAAYTYDTSSYTNSTYHPVYHVGEKPFTSPVGSFAANGYGLYDMAGNVYEWCWDRMDSAYYSVSPATNPRGPTSESYRVFRGGSYIFEANSCRVSYRYYFSPSHDSSHNGFRTVLPADAP